MTRHARRLWTAGIAPTVILGGAALIATAAFPQPTLAAAAPDPTAAAVAQVHEQTVDLTRGLACWEDPTGHNPTSAVVKDVDGTTAYRVTAETAWGAAHRGDVWVLSWCESAQP